MVGEAEVYPVNFACGGWETRRLRSSGLESLLLGARRNDRRGINTTVGRRDVSGDQTFAAVVAAHALEHGISDQWKNHSSKRSCERRGYAEIAMCRRQDDWKAF